MIEVRDAIAPLRHKVGSARELIASHVGSVSRSYFMETSCEQPVEPPVEGIEFRKGSFADLQFLTRHEREYDFTDTVFGYERFEKGDSLMIGQAGGEIVYYSWLMYGSLDLDQRVIVPTWPDAAYSYKVFTKPSARGRRICRAYYVYAKQLLGAQGYRRLICRVGIGNRSSLIAHERAGFASTGRLWKVVLAHRAYYHPDAQLRTWMNIVCPESPFAGDTFVLKDRM